jgi:hypothetical protein
LAALRDFHESNTSFTHPQTGLPYIFSAAQVEQYRQHFSSVLTSQVKQVKKLGEKEGVSGRGAYQAGLDKVEREHAEGMLALNSGSTGVHPPHGSISVDSSLEKLLEEGLVDLGEYDNIRKVFLSGYP